MSLSRLSLLLSLAVFSACDPEKEPAPDETLPAEDCADGVGIAEACNGLDDDCDGATDNGVLLSLWADNDGDGFGAGAEMLLCEAAAGLAENADDCDDASATVFPGAFEACNGIDDDCNGTPESGYGVWYVDADGDAYGDPATALETCDAPAGAILVGDDCNDADPSAYPGATEACDSLPGEPDDDNCDGRADLGVVSTWYTDDDGDGYGHPYQSSETCDPDPSWVQNGEDCRPAEADAFPGAPEICDGIDQSCDGVVDEGMDADGDGHKQLACADGDDCDDAAGDVYPDAPETCGDSLDQDCDGDDVHCSFGGTYDETLADAVLYSASANFDAGERVDVGDVDGDGFDDVVIAVMYADSYAGGAYVVPGPVSGGSTLDFSGYRIRGDDTTDSAGRSLGVGDVNGDGFDDVALGGPDTACIEWIHFGPLSSDVDLVDADVVRNGAADTEAGHGSDLADVDGDGIADLLVGAYEDDDNAYNAGAVYVEYGPISAGTADLEDSYDAKLLGESANAYAGRYLTAGSDVDGDGIGDMLLTSPYASGGGAPYSGAAYLVHGGVTGTFDLSAADGKYLGEGASDYAGEGFAIGDFDGDGLGDVVLGSYNSTAGYQAGAAYVVYGPASGTIALSAADVIIRGTAAGQMVGIGAAVEDVDGDGAGELLIGGAGDSTSGASAGATWLFFGPPAASLTLADADAVFYGANAGDKLGLSVAIGDLDADGFGDLVMGAPGDATGGSGAGAVYVEIAVQ